MNNNQRIAKELESLMEKTLLERLKEDKKFQSVRETLSEGEQATLDAYMEQYMNAWQKELIDPLVEVAKNPKEREQLRKRFGQKFNVNL
jgi:chromatin segregation and condensation protein Rec8/ScpA/Scc1 (kleisin family)